MREHLIAINTSLNLFDKFIKEWVKENKRFRETVRELRAQEKTADKIRDDLEDVIVESNIPPIVEEHLLDFIIQSDKIAGHAKRCATNLSLIDPGEITKEIKQYLEEYAKIILSSFKRLVDAFDKLKEGKDEVNELVWIIDELETNADEKYILLKKEMINIGTKQKNIGILIVLDHAIRDIEGVTDQIEKSANELRKMVLL